MDNHGQDLDSTDITGIGIPDDMERGFGELRRKQAKHPKEIQKEVEFLEQKT